VPGAPGRVVTLVPERTLSVTGAAFRVAPDAVGQVLARLDHREKGGYARAVVPVEDLGTGDPFAHALVYRALPGNPSWLGPADLDAIAAQVRDAVGPSGRNDEYVLRLAEALPEPDPHVAALAALLRRSPRPSSRAAPAVRAPAGGPAPTPGPDRPGSRGTGPAGGSRSPA